MRPLLLGGLLALLPSCMTGFHGVRATPDLTALSIPEASMIPGQNAAALALDAATERLPYPVETIGLNFNTNATSYVTATHRDTHGLTRAMAEVEGEACAYGIFLPFSALSTFAGVTIPSLDISWGDGGYAAALQSILKQATVKGTVTQLSDVRADLHIVHVLGIFGERCTVLHGKSWTEARK